MDQTVRARLITIAAKKEKAAVVYQNIQVIDVMTRETYQADVAVDSGYIVAVGEGYEGVETIDGTGKFIAPSFIDGHVHIESSMVTPSEYEQAILPLGVTTIIADPHEIANVKGAEGLQFMLDDAEGLSLDVRMMLPSCVPATSFEHAGASLDAKALEPFVNHQGVHGLGEVMDYPAVERADADMLKKIEQIEAAGKLVDGHAAGLGVRELNIYGVAGIRTDHESVSKEEAIARARRGLYVEVREGSAARNLREVLDAVTESNASRFLFCTDDKHLDDTLREGTIDYNIRYAIRHGIKRETAYAMASLHAANAYQLHDRGAIVPGRRADYVILSDANQVVIDEVFVKGESVARNGKTTVSSEKTPVPATLRGELKTKPITDRLFELSLEEPKAHVIGIIPKSIVTEHLILDVPLQDGKFVPVPEQDLLKIAVIERHHATDFSAVGIVKGFKMKRGAIAATVAHDSHNLVIVGTSDAEMKLAAERLVKAGGGVIAVNGTEVLAELPLEIAGLMTSRPFQEVGDTLEALNDALDVLEADRSFNPYLTMSFLCLPVIPNLKLTDSGLFDVKTFQHISVQA
ncbi:adenine deaminase [Exiguobacterium antarcticum]|uniref:adenine deaminase n=1 Tax=Exiguobacterium antarcticum TaxID=132920 RepID=UPI000285E9FA|nr:adenine deaminase [Exiguobacterium antarcticum]AFS69633.1 Adenine deaminase [Exiguobacterium antarcticum B7]